MIVKIELSESAEFRRLAKAEIVFTEGICKGLNLVGFNVVTTTNGELTVLFPSTAKASGERFFFLRPTERGNPIGLDTLADAILDAYDLAIASREKMPRRGAAAPVPVTTTAV